MRPARTSQRLHGATRLLVLQPALTHARVDQLPDFLQPGDLLIVNRSATLPSSFRGQVAATGEKIEIRLAAFQGAVASDLRHWAAFSFGSGNWRMPTEERGVPPILHAGDRVIFGSDLSAVIVSVEQQRLLQLRFESSRLEAALYAHGQPIQYSYLKEALAVWDQQTLFAGPPLSTEAPSAAFPFTWDLVLRLKQKGVGIATVLHGAGLSSTGSPALDALLPLAEYYEVPGRTVEKVRTATEQGARIIALGTSALRALESAADGDGLQARSGLTRLIFGPERRPRLAHGLITGMHELGTSHRRILASFMPEDQLAQGFAAAEEQGYRSHEYGDICLAARHFDSLS